MTRLAEAEQRWSETSSEFIPDDKIPNGDETGRLHRWGYIHYREMFNSRQLLGLELSARIITQVGDDRVRNALATNLSDLLRYQNMLCRYDTRALKSLDIFSVHGFPVGLIQCESNLLGIQDSTRPTCVGSGGWANIIEKFRKAKSYCDHPFEVKYQSGRKKIVSIDGEWIGDHFNGDGSRPCRMVSLSCQDAADSSLPDSTLDAVFTDPPYFGNVQYAELMDFCYVWLRRLLGHGAEGFGAVSTRKLGELTANADMGRGLEHFAEGLSRVFQRMSNALKPGAPLAFTYHHNSLEAYYPVAVAILDSGLTCSASLPCPAEMGASIHISGTASSIIDTVFVSRATGAMQRKWLAESVHELARVVAQDLALLRMGNVKPSEGDTRCITYGHLTRLAIWNLRHDWDRSLSTRDRIARIAIWLGRFGGWPEVKACLEDGAPQGATPAFDVREAPADYGVEYADIPF